jgi:hypothetical protein
MMPYSPMGAYRPAIAPSLARETSAYTWAKPPSTKSSVPVTSLLSDRGAAAIDGDDRAGDVAGSR